MHWLREHGICSTLQELGELDERVLADCRLWMWAEVMRGKLLKARGE